MKTVVAPLLALLWIAAALGAAAETWVPLFDGTTLNGWHRAAYGNGQAEYTVQDGCIVGTTRANTPNSFLCADRLYANFILEFEFRVPAGMNSGVQIRSICDPEVNKGRVHGYQVEIDPSARAWTGGIYDEARRGWLYNLTHIEKERGKEAAEAARLAFKADAWNHIRVEARGAHMRTWLNGIAVADLTDAMTPSGVIALQVHATPDPQPKQVRWRNIRLQDLGEDAGSDEAWKALSTWTYAQSRAAWTPVENEVRAAEGEAWASIEAKLLGLLQDREASLDARRFACGWLGRKGSPRAVPGLTRCLADRDVAAIALQALARLPHSEATVALAAALRQDLAPTDLAALVTLLGERRSAPVVADLARLVTGTEASVQRAALMALGRIGTPAAEEALRQTAVPVALLPLRSLALLDCAEQARRDGDRSRAERLCRELLTPETPELCRAASLTVLTDTIGDLAIPELLAALEAGPAPLRDVAVQRLAGLPGVAASRAAAALVATLPPALQAITLTALAASADDTLAAAAAGLLKSTDDTVRLAAVRLLQVAGRPEDVPALVEAAVGTGPVAAAALQALARAKGSQIEPTLLDAARRSTSTAQRSAALTALSQRGSAQAVPIALSLIAATPDADAQRALWRVLRDLAGPEHLELLLKAVSLAPDAAVRREAEKATAECLRRAPDPTAAGALVQAALPAAPATSRPTLVALLGLCRTDAAAAALGGLLQDSDRQCRYEAVKALASWDSATPYEVLKAYATATDQETHHVLALRGCVRMLDLMQDLPEADRLRRLDDLAACARRDEEKELVRVARIALRVSDLKAASGKPYALLPMGFVKGNTVYIDRPYTFTSIPAPLTDAVLIQTAMDDKASRGTAFLSFALSAPATVIVCYDGRAKAPPDWLKGWRRLEPVLKTTDTGCALTLFAQAFPAGKVTLAGNCPVAGVGAMYIAAVVAETALPPDPAPENAP